MQIRSYMDSDADLIAELYNSHPENPNPVAGGITGEQLRREFEERGTKGFLIAEENGQIVATFGIFSSIGRLTANENEMFADMFFVAPGHRKGTLTGQLFTAAVIWMLDHDLEVLRLTVNPANRDAFRLYRRVGCISRGRGRPGVDGSVELYCYLPLVLKHVRNHITEDERRHLPELIAVGSVLKQLGDDLTGDVMTQGDRSVVQYQMSFGSMIVEACIDVDRAELLSATVMTPDGVRNLPVRPSSTPRPEETKLQTSRRWGERVINVLTDGAIAVYSDDHLGPLISLTWPDAAPHRAAGWRGGPRHPLSITERADVLTLTDESSGLSCRIALSGDLMVTKFSGEPGQTMKMFQELGLRLAKLDADPMGEAPIRQASVALGLTVRDSTQIPAAGLPLWPGTPIRWTDESTVIELSGNGDMSLVTSSLVERHVTLNEEGAATLTTRISNYGTPSPQRNADASHSGSPEGVEIRFDPGAGGIVRWRHDGAAVLHCPYPRVRRLSCNPSWSTGMWVTREGDRHNREIGMGWGLPHPDWLLGEENSLSSPTQDITWVLDPNQEHCNWNINISTTNPTGEIALWLTPAVAAGSRVRLSNRGEVETATVGAIWQRWTSRLGVELASGEWLCLEPTLGQQGFPEIIVRSTGNDLLVGCVIRASARTARWRLALLENTSGLVGRHSYLASF